MEKLEKGEGIGGVVVVVEHEGGQPDTAAAVAPPRTQLLPPAAWGSHDCCRGKGRCCRLLSLVPVLVVVAAGREWLIEASC